MIRGDQITSRALKLLEDGLTCPDCGQGLSIANGQLHCEACLRDYPSEDGILLLLPSETPETPSFYDDENYRTFASRLPDLHRAHYEKGSLTGLFEKKLKADLLRITVDPTPPYLDIGCGTGSGFGIIGPTEEIIGIDMDLSLLKQCRRNYPEAVLICCDMRTPPFRDGCFKTCFSIGTLEHIFHLEAFLDQVERKLAADGVFYVTIPTEGGLAWGLLRRCVTAPSYSRLLEVDYRRALAIEHCNTVFAIDNALHKYFVVEARRFFPWRFGGYHPNLAVSYRLRRRT